MSAFPKIDEIQLRLLEEVADLHEVPEGAYNIRANGKLADRVNSANIEIVSKEDGTGIDIHIKPGTKKESVHIPVVLSETGLKETVYNDFFIGDDCVLTVGGLEDQEVTVGIRPEGFILDENGPLTCHLNNVEVMGRDVSVVSTHPASLKPSVRSIIDADDRSGLKGETVRYSVKPHKLFVFHKETEQRLAFEVK